MFRFPSVFFFLVIIGIFLVFLLLSANETVAVLLESTAFSLVRKFIYSGSLVCLALFAKPKPSAVVKISVLLSAAFPWIFYVFSSVKINYIIGYFTILFTFVSIFYSLLKKEIYPVLFSVQVLFLCLTFVNLNGYIFELYSDIKYTLPAFILGTAFALLFASFLEKGIIVFENNTKSNHIVSTVVAGCLAFFLVFYGGKTLNYTFDFSTKSEHNVPISDKDFQFKGRGSRHYYIYVDWKGTPARFEVSATEYYSVEIGDTITITQYDGFLGDEYIIVNENG